MTKTITANCVDEALFRGLELLVNEGVRQDTRAGEVLVVPYPVMTCNEQPLNRVSFNSKRDANPFFHLMEALWMLAGRNDITWLDQFVGDFSQRFGDSVSIHEHPSGLLQHGAYGFRWRQHFDIEGGGGGWPPDQLNKIVEMLKANHQDRRVVLTMWDPVADLGANVKDVPCNTHIYPRVRHEPDGDLIGVPHYNLVLDLTVCCRSNDAVWGAHGANAVHFSILQEYLAARISVGVGKLYQLSNNYHVYTSALNKVWPMGLEGTVPHHKPAKLVKLVHEPEHFDDDLKLFFQNNWEHMIYRNAFFALVAIPLRQSYALWRERRYNDARGVIFRMLTCDWSVAAGSWYGRRMHGHLT